MEGIRFIDIYATKGIEYLIVISFLAAFVLFCRYMYQPREKRAATRIAPENATRFRVPEGLFYHQGHGWLRPEPGSIGVVGLDDFAQKLIGKIDAVELPPVGSRLAQGDKGWSLVVDAVPIPMLSPVAGEVVEEGEEEEAGWFLVPLPEKKENSASAGCEALNLGGCTAQSPGAFAACDGCPADPR